jgi:creatinine amidohydrolase/Fe(II)-dependent formamide hydrolase-like protein
LDELALDPPELLRLQREHPDNYQRAEKIVDDIFVVPRITQRPDIQVGVMGEPAKASRELGLEVVADIVECVSVKIADLEAKSDGIYREVTFVPEPIIVSGD